MKNELMENSNENYISEKKETLMIKILLQHRKQIGIGWELDNRIRLSHEIVEN